MLVPIEYILGGALTTSVMVSWNWCVCIDIGPNRFPMLYSNLVKNGHKPPCHDEELLNGALDIYIYHTNL